MFHGELIKKQTLSHKFYFWRINPFLIKYFLKLKYKLNNLIYTRLKDPRQCRKNKKKGLNKIGKIIINQLGN